MGLFDPIERAARQHAADLARVASIGREIETCESRRSDGVTFDALVAADEEVQALRRRLVIAEGVAARSSGLLAEARAQATAAQAKAKNAEMERAAKAAEKRVRAIFDMQDKLRTELSWLAGHVEEFDRYNAEERGDLPFVADGERRVRERMGQGLPAITRLDRVWVDTDGNRVNPQAYNADGRTFWRRDVHEIEVEQTIREAMPGVPEMPSRICDEVRLVDLEGRTLWPR